MSEPIQDVLAKIANRARPVSGSVAPVQPAGPCSPDCPFCGGIGWIRADVDIHHPDFGRLKPCPRLDPFKLYPHLGIAEQDRRLNWESIIDRENVMDAVKAVRKALDRGYGWVFLWGGYGLAKTLILKIAVAQTVANFQSAAYVRMPEILDNLRRAFDAKDAGSESERRLDFWAGVPVLAIDEFDRVRLTEWGEEKQFLIMDRRYEDAARSQGVTLMTSNTNPDLLDGYLFDRIRDRRFEIVRLTGDSAR